MLVQMPFIVWGVPVLGMRFCTRHVVALAAEIDVWIFEMWCKSKSAIARFHFPLRCTRRFSPRNQMAQFLKYTKELDTVRAD